MMDFLINDNELTALSGLPHIQQLAYLRAIRPYMDVKTGVVGIKRGISYQSIAEQLYVESHQGIQSVSYSRAQLRRALMGLERAGLICFQSEELKLILKCSLATLGHFAQNKAVTNPSQQAVISCDKQLVENNDFSEEEPLKADIARSAKADIPLIYRNNNYFFYLGEQFKKFWALYPVKRGKQQAWETFQTLAPDEALFETLFQSLHQQCDAHLQQKAQGRWVPNWCNPANWLSQKRWEDEINFATDKEIRHEPHQKPATKRSAKDIFWQPCEDNREEEPASTNVIEFKRRHEQG